MLRRIPAPIKFLILSYLECILIFTAARVLLLLLHVSTLNGIPFYYILKSFQFGLGFDTVIICYIFAIPFLVFFIFSFRKKRNPFLDKIVVFLMAILFIICLLLVCADIPWFKYQQTRLTTVSLQWANTPWIMTRIIFQDINNYPFIILLIVLTTLFLILFNKIKSFTLNKSEDGTSRLVSTSMYLILAVFIFFGMRGRIALKSPIRWGSSFISEHNFTNQLGLNPVYTFMQSWIDDRSSSGQHLNYLPEALAISFVKSYYKIQGGMPPQPSLRREILYQGKSHDYNIVLVLMESMTCYNMQSFGNSRQLTPVLDDLYKKSLVFSNFYSDGIHTFNGIYSSLFGMPSLSNRHHMKDLRNQQSYGGLAKTLAANNYRTVFFTSHDEQFDNMGGFLASNGFQEIISQKDYNHDKVLNVLGIPDHILFSEAVSHLSQLNRTRHPFFATILTASNHGPYEIPQDINFSSRFTDIKSQLIEYCDWSIGQFLESCRKEPWFDSTVFIFTGDHGGLVGDMDMYLTYHHVPLIIYAPEIISPEINPNLGGQIDIFPLAMSLLNRSFSNNSFGIDISKTPHQFITFTYDDEYGAFSDRDFYVNRKNKSCLFLINPEARYCKKVNNLQRQDSMLNYVRAIMQTKQFMIDRHYLN
jgi:phosphoglycerol transferase MdoB-like AlkP superfamily enzyme